VFDASGTVSVGVVLGPVGATLAATGPRCVVRTDDHDHGAVSSLRTGVVGAFALSLLL
jgi:hypothetical protein